MDANGKIRILLYTRQPFIALGLAAALKPRADCRLVACCDSLSTTLACLQPLSADIVLLYLTAPATLCELQQLRSAAGPARIVLWGQALTGEFAFQAMQLGVRSILPAESPVDALLATLHSVHRGAMCFDKDLLDSVLFQSRVTLTRRQSQIVSLVAQGFRNKEIAASLGITEGTVKFYLYKLFKKLGINDRLNMALYGMKNLYNGQLARAAPIPFGPRSLPAQSRERPRLHVVN